MGGSDGKASAHNVGDPGSILGLGRSPGEENGSSSTPVFLPEKFHGQKSLAGYSLWVTKSRTQLGDFTFFHFHKLIIILCHKLEDR